MGVCGPAFGDGRQPGVEQLQAGEGEAPGAGERASESSSRASLRLFLCTLGSKKWQTLSTLIQALRTSACCQRRQAMLGGQAGRRPWNQTTCHTLNCALAGGTDRRGMVHSSPRTPVPLQSPAPAWRCSGVGPKPKSGSAPRIGRNRAGTKDLWSARRHGGSRAAAGECSFLPASRCLSVCGLASSARGPDRSADD